LIFAPKELVAIKEILRSHLGSNASGVEAACAKAQELSGEANRKISIGIRSVVSAWTSGRFPEAVVLARELRKNYPKSADVAQILGSALLRCSPPDYKEADRELEAARRLGCTRLELLGNIVKAKIGIGDWQGLYEITKPLSSNEAGQDVPLDAFLHSCWQLIATAKDRSDHPRAAELCIEAVEKISYKISHHRLDQGYFSKLVGSRSGFAHEYIKELNRSNPRPGDKLRVFEGVSHLADAQVVLSDLLKAGLTALETWWGDVEERPIVDQIACSILGKQLKRLDKMGEQYATYGHADDPLLTRVSGVRRDLAYRGAKLSG
jgi:hypothetical protein